jgi:hypothetical protein
MQIITTFLFIGGEGDRVAVEGMITHSGKGFDKEEHRGIKE